MKLTETINLGAEFDDNLLTEALRVSNNDIQKMMRLNQNDFLIGVEYEFHLNDTSPSSNAPSGVDPDIASMATSQAEEELENRINDAVLPLARIAVSMLDIFADGNEFIEALYDEEPSTDDLSNEEKLMQLAKVIHSTKLTFSTMLDGDPVFEQAIDVDLVRSMKNVYEDRISINIPEMVQLFFRQKEDDVEKMLDGLEDLAGMSTNVNSAVRHMTNNITRYSEWYNDELDAEVSSAISAIQDADDEFGGSSDANVSFVKSTLPNDVKSFISTVELDGSVSNGVEVVTKPLRPDTTLEIMQDMFEYIKEHGFTSMSTGLHINISHRSFVTGKIPDPLKIMALMDVDAFQDATNVKRHVKYPERNYMVEQLTSDLSHEGILSTIAKAYVEGGVSDMEDMIKHVIVRSNKYKSVNWTHFLKEYDPSQKRIELRFFGGDSYENRFKEISADMMFIMYVIQAVTNSSYKPEVYYRGLYRILDRAAKRAGLSSFNQVLQSQR